MYSLTSVKDISNVINVIRNLVFCPQKTVHSGKGGGNINTLLSLGFPLIEMTLVPSYFSNYFRQNNSLKLSSKIEQLQPRNALTTELIRKTPRNINRFIRKGQMFESEIFTRNTLDIFKSKTLHSVMEFICLPF